MVWGSNLPDIRHLGDCSWQNDVWQWEKIRIFFFKDSSQHTAVMVDMQLPSSPQQYQEAVGGGRHHHHWCAEHGIAAAAADNLPVCSLNSSTATVGIMEKQNQIFPVSSEVGKIVNICFESSLHNMLKVLLKGMKI